MLRIFSAAHVVAMHYSLEIYATVVLWLVHFWIEIKQTLFLINNNNVMESLMYFLCEWVLMPMIFTLCLNKATGWQIFVTVTILLKLLKQKHNSCLKFFLIWLWFSFIECVLSYKNNFMT